MPVDERAAEIVSAVGIAAGRIRRYGEAIAQAHAFGIKGGSHKDLSIPRYQREAMPIYRETLPWAYLVDLANKFDLVASKMGDLDYSQAPPPGWVVVLRYLESLSVAVREVAPESITRSADYGSTLLVDPLTPPVLRFGQLARIVRPSGAAALIESAGAVEEFCGEVDDCALTEQEKVWMSRLINGHRVVDIAVDDGYSERTLYRILSELWERLGVGNRNEAFALASQNGWLD